MNTTNLVKMTLGLALATLAVFNSDADELTPSVTSVIDASLPEGGSLLPETKLSAPKLSESKLSEPKLTKPKISKPKLEFSELLSEFDVDKDGALSGPELSSSDNEALKLAVKYFDLDNDGNITSKEYDTIKAVKFD